MVKILELSTFWLKNLHLISVLEMADLYKYGIWLLTNRHFKHKVQVRLASPWNQLLVITIFMLRCNNNYSKGDYHFPLFTYCKNI